MPHPLVTYFESTLPRNTFSPFSIGDAVAVNIKIVEGEKTRLQEFAGVVIAKKNNGYNSSFTVRKISHSIAVEKIFPMHSPLIDSVEIVRRGDVRKAKLYYLRDRSGKSARIKEKLVSKESKAAQ